MEKNKWIKAAGTACEADIPALADRFFAGEAPIYLAGCTDCYRSGREGLSVFLSEKADTLLELRVFTEKKELLLTRSAIGHYFTWRVTGDEGLDDYDYIDSEQFIDINTERTYEADGLMRIFSTVGGRYSLPLAKGENAVRVRAYVSYDHNSIGKIIDHRVCGFLKKREA